MSTPDVVQKSTSDPEKAKAYRERALDLLERFQAVMADAQRDGMIVQMGQIQIDPFGRPLPLQVNVHKVLA